VIKFTVYGKPQPQGSTRGFVYNTYNPRTNQMQARAAITSDNAANKPWRQQVTQMAAIAAKGELIPRGTPVSIWLIFYFDPPKSLKKSASRLKTTKPDIDKLIRSVLDALTGTIFEDDSQVAVCRMQKCFAQPERLEVFVGAIHDQPRAQVPEEKDLQRPLDFAFAEREAS
jgi:Holliday junction resolvase RusA-like endonuclease